MIKMNNDKIYCEFCGKEFKSYIGRNRHLPFCEIEKNSIENIDIYFNFEKLEIKSKKKVINEKELKTEFLGKEDNFILNSTTLKDIRTINSIYGEFDVYTIDTKFKKFHLTRNQIKHLDEALRQTKTFLPKKVVYKGKEEGKNPFETKHTFEIK